MENQAILPFIVEEWGAIMMAILREVAQTMQNFLLATIQRRNTQSYGTSLPWCNSDNLILLPLPFPQKRNHRHYLCMTVGKLKQCY